MHKFVMALICAAMVFLVSSRAAAVEWQCSAWITVHEIGAKGWAKAKRSTVISTAGGKSTADALARTAIVSGEVRRLGADRVDANSVWVSCRESKALPMPTLPPKQAAKPSTRTWTCRVKLTWQVGARRGSVDETWSDIEAPSEAAAMGAAIFRSQSRLMALTLNGTRPAWPKTDVKCS